MVHNFSTSPSLLSQYVHELRDTTIQADRTRFRYNLNRVGRILAYELSKTLPYKEIETETPLGTADSKVLDTDIVLGTILRAGLPMHEGMLSMFDLAENAFISAYRRHHRDGTFEIMLEYCSCPDITDKTLIVCDPMIASGASAVLTIEALAEFGQPKEIHFVTIIASTEGIENLERKHPNINIWTAAIDQEMTAKSYIVPGLGDAGDLAFGEKTI